jgi:hypothetical protein
MRSVVMPDLILEDNIWVVFSVIPFMTLKVLTVFEPYHPRSAWLIFDSPPFRSVMRVESPATPNFLSTFESVVAAIVFESYLPENLKGCSKSSSLKFGLQPALNSTMSCLIVRT